MKTADIDLPDFIDKGWDEAIESYNTQAAAHINRLTKARVDAMRIADGVGDITSTTKGSGARFNADKPDFSLIPLHTLSRALLMAGVEHIGEVVGLIADYQEDQDVISLYKAMALLGNDGWEECVRVFMYGKVKYAAWNWAKGMAWSVPLACAVRHLLSIADGHDIDAESGLPHRGHVYCNLIMLITYHESYPEGNDFPRKGMFTALVPVGTATEFP